MTMPSLRSAGLAQVQDKQEDMTRDALMRAIDAPSWAARAKSAERIAALYCRTGLDPATRRLAEEGFRVLRYDSETVVRRLLAECLKEASHLPRDIALSLATDAAEVAAAFLAHSPALADRDLIAVLADHPGRHRMAIAQRRPLSEAVADALCRCGDRAVVLAVLSNDAATIGEATLHFLLDEPADQDDIHQAVARRKLLPIGVGERLRGFASTARPTPTNAILMASCGGSR
jgi:uncharacterized protein (DUF2336 family)